MPRNLGELSNIPVLASLPANPQAGDACIVASIEYICIVAGRWQALSRDIRYSNIQPALAGATRAERYKSFLSRAIESANNIYYASPDGSSANSGTRVSPWSLQHALDQLQAGDALLLLSGVYTSANPYGTGAYTTLNSGTSTAPITIASENLHGARIHSTTASYGFFIFQSNDYWRVLGLEITGLRNIGINCIGIGCELLYNYIHDLTVVDNVDGGAGIQIYEQTGANMNTRIEGNIIHDIGDYNAYSWGNGSAPANNTYGILIYGNNNIIKNNVIFRINANGVGAWGSNQNNVVAHNTIWGCKNTGVRLGAGGVATPICQNNTTAANIIAHCMFAVDVVNATGLNIWDRNLLWGNQFNFTIYIASNGGLTNTIAADPQLIFPAYRGDFRPVFTSPARGAALATYLPALDCDLLPRATDDIGAFAVREEIERETTGLHIQHSHRFSLPLALPPGFPNTNNRPTIGMIGASALATLTLVANRAYWLPLKIDRWMRCATLIVAVTTASAGTHTLYFYDSNSVGQPLKRLSSATFDSGTTGEKNVSFNQVLEPGVYWICLLAASAPVVRAVAVAGAAALLNLTNSTAAITHFFTTGAPGNSAPVSGYSIGTGNIPAIGIEYVL